MAKTFENKSSSRILGVLAISGLLAFGVYKYYFRKKTLMSQPPLSANQKGPSLKSLLNRPLPSTAPPLQVKDGELDAGCASFWNSISTMNMEDLAFPPKIDKLLVPTDCNLSPATVSNYQNEYLERCKDFLNPITTPASAEEWDHTIADCRTSLFVFRAAITDWRYKNTPLAEISDLKILADRAVIQFLGALQDQSFAHAETLTKIGERITEVDPRNYAGSKLTLTGDVFQAIATKGAVPANPEFWESTAKHLEQAGELNASDPELTGMAQYVRLRGGYDPERVRSQASEQLNENPNSVQTLRELAYAQWRLGQKEQSFASLARAMKLSPNNPELSNNWNAIHAPGAGPEAFRIDLKMSFNFENY